MNDRTEKVDAEPYRIDDARFARGIETGIYVRAQNKAGVWGAFDIFSLDRESLGRWLRSRGGANEFAENLVYRLLEHPR